MNEKSFKRIISGIHYGTAATGIMALTLLLFAAGAAADPVKRDFINPAAGYTQVVAVTANGVKTLYISGQVSEGETIEAQLRGAFASLRQQLADAGAALSDVVKMNTYIVNYQSENLDTFRTVRDEFFAPENRPASTLVGVTSLALTKYRVEIEATAVLAAD